MHNAEPARPARAILLFLVGSAGFALAYCQAPLYYSNQNQYFLHGLAHAGEGFLADDWLANTRDPTPVFSFLVEITARFLHPWAFHAWYALLMGAYAAAMLGLFLHIAGERGKAGRWAVFLALFVLFHSALLRWGSYQWLDWDYPWYFQAGLAGQYILGAMFQPSTFGVLLVVSVCLFARGRPYLAAVLAALSATAHSTYLLPAGMLTLGYLTALCIEGKVREAALTGTIALLLVLPVTLYVLIAFAPTSAETFAESQDIVANFRIPHHCRPGYWFDWLAGLQVGWVLLALVLTWRTRLFAVLIVPFVLALVLTLAQVLTGSDTLALLFPWRVSAVLVPIATTVILSRLVAALPAALDSPGARWVSGVVVVTLAAGGVWISATGQGFQVGNEDVGLIEHVRENRRRGELYFVWVRVAKGKPGSPPSSDFEPLARKKSDPGIIPVNLQRFRLHTGVPILVDFKSIPYRDTDVIEWRARIRLALEVQEHIEAGRSTEALAELRRHGVTHVVVPADRSLPGAGDNLLPGDRYYRLYQIADLASP